MKYLLPLLFVLTNAFANFHLEIVPKSEVLLKAREGQIAQLQSEYNLSKVEATVLNLLEEGREASVSENYKEQLNELVTEMKDSLQTQDISADAITIMEFVDAGMNETAAELISLIREAELMQINPLQVQKILSDFVNKALVILNEAKNADEQVLAN